MQYEAQTSGIVELYHCTIFSVLQRSILKHSIYANIILVTYVDFLFFRDRTLCEQDILRKLSTIGLNANVLIKISKKDKTIPLGTADDDVTSLFPL